MKEDIGRSRRERQRVHLGEKNGEWDSVWEEMRSDIRIGRVVEPLEKSYTLNVERTNNLIRRSVVNLYPQTKNDSSLVCSII